MVNFIAISGVGSGRPRRMARAPLSGASLLLCTARVVSPQPTPPRGDPCRPPLPAPPPDTTWSRSAARRRPALDALLADATAKVRERVVGRRPRRQPARLDREQRAAHGLAWLATYVEAVRQLAAYAERMSATARSAKSRSTSSASALGEYIAQIVGGIPMSQGEMVRPADLGLSPAQVAARINAGGRKPDRRRQYRRAARPPGRADAREPWRHGRRLRPRRHAGIDPRGDAQIRRQRSDRPARKTGIAPTATSRSKSSRRCPSSACSG